MQFRLAVPILTGLGLSSVSRLEILEISYSWKAASQPTSSVAMSYAIRALLLSTTASTFQTLRFTGNQFIGETFGPLAHGICQSKNATTIHFNCCDFDMESMNLLEQAFQSSDFNGKMNTLEICEAFFPSTFGKSMGTVLKNIISSTTSTLRNLKLQSSFCRSRNLHEVTVIMQAVSRSVTLECFQIDDVDTVDKCRAIAAGIAKARTLKQFHFNAFSGNLDVKRLLWQAFRKNTSLECIVFGRGYNNIFTDNDIARLAKYAARNKALPRLIDPPSNIPIMLGSRLIKSLFGCERGPDTVFRVLVSFGGSVGRSETVK